VLSPLGVLRPEWEWLFGGARRFYRLIVVPGLIAVSDAGHRWRRVAVRFF